MGIIGNIVAPRHDLAGSMARNLRDAATNVDALIPRFGEGAYPMFGAGTGDLHPMSNLVQGGDPVVTDLAKALGDKSFDRGLVPRGLRADNVPPSVGDAQRAVRELRADVSGLQAAAKQGGDVSVAAAEIHGRLTDLSTQLKAAHFAVGEKDTAKAINAEAPHRKVRAAATVGLLSAGAAVGGVAGYDVLTGTNVLGDTANQAIDQARQLVGADG